MSGDVWAAPVAFYESVEITRKDGKGKVWVPGWRPLKRALTWQTLCRCMTTFRRASTTGTEEERKARVPLWSPGVPVGDHREKGAVREVSCLVLDVDGGTDFRELAINLFRSWPLVYHTSFRTRPEKPKGRVIVPFAEPVPSEWWPRAWWWANRRVGGAMDPATKDPCRVYYLPASDGRPGHEARVIDEGGNLLDLRPYDRLPPTPEEEEEAARMEWAARMPVGRWRPGQGDLVTREQRYAAKVLEGACKRIAEALPGNGKGVARNVVLSKEAFVIGGYVGSGCIERAIAEAAIVEAGIRNGSEPDRVRDTALRQLAAGALKPIKPDLE